MFRMLIFLVVLLWSCSSNKREKFFYENGNLRADLGLENGKKSGYCKFYFENGNIYQEGEYRDDLIYGKHYEYFEHHEGRLNIESDFLIVEGKSVLISRIEFDSLGRKVSESPRVEITAVTDPILVNEPATLRLELINPANYITEFYVLPLDENFVLQDTISVEFYQANEHVADITLTPTARGQNCIRGQVRNFAIVHVSDSTAVSADDYYSYFEYCYYVD